MTPETILAECQARGIRLATNGDKLHVEAPAGTLDADMRAALARFKTDLLQLLTSTERVTVVAKTSTGRATVDMQVSARHMPEMVNHGVVVRFKLVDDQGGGTLIDPEGWESARQVLEEKYGARLERLWRIGEAEGNQP